MPIYVGAQNTSTQAGGGEWEVIATSNFGSSAAAYGESKGWDNTTYVTVKAVLCGVDHGNWSYTPLAVQFYGDDTNGNNGTLDTSDNYIWSSRQRDLDGTSESSNNGTDTFWKFTSQKNTSGEIWFPLKYYRASNDTGIVGRGFIHGASDGSGSWIDSVCIHKNMSYKYLTGARIGKHNNFNIVTDTNWTKGYIKWMGLKV